MTSKIIFFLLPASQNRSYKAILTQKRVNPTTQITQPVDREATSAKNIFVGHFEQQNTIKIDVSLGLTIKAL